MQSEHSGFYRFEAKIISRGGQRSLIASAAYRTGGKSATSAAAYRAGEQLTDERTGETYDYTKKRGIRGAEIMLPEGAPAWMANRARLWNAVEAAEVRKDAQTARDYLLSLPHQLSPEQRRALTKWFVAEQFVRQGYAADIAWHAPDSREGLNHHAHVMVTMRKVEGDGFARTKERPAPGVHPMKAWKDDLMRLREAWALSANRFLEAAGLDVRITHESLQTRGIDREPDPKLGPVAMQMEAAGRASHAGDDRREVAERNALRAELAAEHAKAVAEEARIINLMAERRRRNVLDDKTVETVAREMPELTREAVAELRRAEEAARTILRREAELTAQRIEAFKTQAQRDEDQAKRDHEAAKQAEEARFRDGKISSAEARYTIALGDTAHPDPLTNLVRAAGAESAAFMRQQEAMRAQLADPKLNETQRQELTLRQQIEFHEYQALTNTRLAGMYRVIGGEAHTVQAAHRTGLAAAASKKASELREERGQLLAAEQKRERDQTAGKPAGLAQTMAGGKASEPTPAAAQQRATPADPARPDERTANQTAAKTDDAAQRPARKNPFEKTGEPRDGAAELSEAQQVKLANYRNARAKAAEPKPAGRPEGRSGDDGSR